MQKDMQSGVCDDADEAHDRNDAKAHDILGRIGTWEEIGAVNLSQVSQGIDYGEGDCPGFVGHDGKGAGGIAQAEGVGGPEPRGHENEEDVARDVVVHDAENEGADGRDGEPACDD